MSLPSSGSSFSILSFSGVGGRGGSGGASCLESELRRMELPEVVREGVLWEGEGEGEGGVKIEEDEYCDLWEGKVREGEGRGE